jgi:hypothetical protein
MTTKVNGAAYPGVWVERKVSFVKLTFNVDVAAIAEASLTVLGTATPVVGGGTGASTFGVVESAVVQALKTLETKATVLAVSKYDAASKSIDVMLGNSEGWFSDAAGVIATALPVLGAQAVQASGALVGVAAAAVTFDMHFATLDGTMAIGTLANGALSLGVGATSGATPTNSPTGTAGYYPGTI